MKEIDFDEQISFTDKKVKAEVLLESDYSREIRLVLCDGQEMKEHRTRFPIVIHLLQGELLLGVKGKINRLKKGSMICLGPNVPHDLKAVQDSVVRLSVAKFDVNNSTDG